jgi:hypothetical protein
MFWRKQPKPLEPDLEKIPDEVIRENDDPPMDDDYFPTPYVEVAPKPLASLQSIARAIKEFEEKKMDATQEPKSYVLYTQDGSYHAAGPFDTQRDARLWISGFRAGLGEADEPKLIGMVSDLICFGDVTVKKPDLDQ